MSPGSTVLPELQTLHKRLLVAEELGGQVSRDLSCILEQLRNISKAANITHLTSNTTTNTTPTGHKYNACRRQWSAGGSLKIKHFCYIPYDANCLPTEDS